MAGEGKVRANWNNALMSDVIAPSYVRLLCYARDTIRQCNSNYECLWPSVRISTPWHRLSKSVIVLAKKERLLCTGLVSGSPSVRRGFMSSVNETMGGQAIDDSGYMMQWIPCNTAVVLPVAYDGVVVSADEEGILQQLLLSKARLPVVDCSVTIRDGLLLEGAYADVVSPHFIRSVLRNLIISSLKARTSVDSWTSNFILHLMPMKEWCGFLLRYCLSDCLDDSCFQQLNMLPILPLLESSSCSGANIVGTLRIFTKSQAHNIAELACMGFAPSQALHALSVCKFDVDRACVWLTDQNSSTKVSQGGLPKSNISDNYLKERALLGETFFVLCDSDMETKVFQEANFVLLDRSAINPNEIEYLMNPRFQQLSNIRTFCAALVPDLLRNIMPKSCFAVGAFVKYSELENRISVLQFIGDFFEYSRSRGDVIQAICEGVSIIPLKSECLVPLSKVSVLIAIVAVDSKTDTGWERDNEGQALFHELLLTMGCNVIDNSVMFPSDNAIGDCDCDVKTNTCVNAPSVNALPSVFWEYVGASTSLRDVLRVLDCVLRAGNLHTWQSLLMSNIVTCRHLESLRRFVTNGINRDTRLTDVEIRVLRVLPIYVDYKSMEYAPLVKASSVTSSSNVYKSCGGILEKDFFVIGYAHRIPCVLADDLMLHYDQENPVELLLLQMVGIKKISLSQFYRTHFLPRISALHSKYPEATEDALLTMLSELPILSTEDHSFANSLRNFAFLPVQVVSASSGRESSTSFVKASQLYDPEEAELLDLLPDSLFPAKKFHRKDILVYLRSFGLKTVMDFPAIISCATSIANRGNCAMECEVGADADLGSKLLKFLDKNSLSLFGQEHETTSNVARRPSVLGSLFNSLFAISSSPQEVEDRKEGANQAERMKFVADLLNINWMPVVKQIAEYPFLPMLPAVSCVICPRDCRPLSDGIYCSASKFLVGEPVITFPLRKALGWDEPLPVEAIAVQIRELSVKYLEVEKDESRVADVEKFREMINTLMPRLYIKINGVLTDNETAAVVKCLSGSKWIWVGNTFVSVDSVALVVNVNAAPYFYQLPQDFCVYKNLLLAFKIKQSLTPRDHFQILKQLKNDHEVIAAAGVVESSIPLSEAKLDLAIALVTLLASDSGSLKNLSLCIPDDGGRLRIAEELVCDDVPWLHGPAYASIRSGRHLMHPNISAAVAEKFRVQSLRCILISQNMDQNIFGSGHTTDVAPQVESFGQAESITNRLKSILDLYPEGNPIYAELIQNADDAGATKICFMVDENSYGTESLLGPKMAALQGPSLVVYNDACFTESDYRALGRIGQGSKLENLSTTGRFGLGFNSTYHLTDTPSFVSGEYLVIFDPHCCFAPGATANQPGLRVKYTGGNNLSATFKDQFDCFRHFGCDFEESFNGTLFRFPLRTTSLARQSEISKRRYTAEDIISSLETLVENLPNHLLFLRNLRTIEVYRRGHCASDVPLLLYRTMACKQELRTHNGQSLLQYFDKRLTSIGSRDTFYSKLESTPDHKLPYQFFRMKIYSENFVDIGAVSMVENVRKSNSSDVKSMDRPASGSVEYVVVSGLCGGEAKRMACDINNRHLKLIPLGCVAACMGGVSKTQQIVNDSFPSIEGVAFCFLPLPVHTQLPVHVNAYWELSSNRRDIWHGDDTSGDAKLRSNWNICIVQNVLGPLYAKLIKFVSTMSPETHMKSQSNKQNVLRLLPCPLPQQEFWKNLGECVFALIQTNCPIVWSNIRGGSHLSLGDCILLINGGDDAFRPAGITSVENSDMLESILLAESIPVCVVSNVVATTLANTNYVKGIVSPSFVRKHFTSLAPLDISETSVRSIMTSPGGTKNSSHSSKSSAVFRSAPHPSIDSTVGSLSVDKAFSNAIFLLQYCVKDITDENFELLHNVRLIPLDDGSLGKFIDIRKFELEGRESDAMYYTVTDLERNILKEHCGNRIVVPDSTLGTQVTACVKDVKFGTVCNIRSLDPLDMRRLVSQVLPKSWYHGNDVLNIVNRDHVLSNEWLCNMWTYLIDRNYTELDFMPLLPILSPSSMPPGSYIVKASSTVPILSLNTTSSFGKTVVDSPLSQDVANALSDLGLYVFDPSVLGRLSFSDEIDSILCKPTAKGIIQALNVVCNPGSTPDASKTWSSITRLALRDFVLDYVVAKMDLEVDDAAVLWALPIWAVHDGHYVVGMETDVFASFTMNEITSQKVMLPPVGIEAVILSKKYVKTRSPLDRSLYISMGMCESTRGQFYANDVVPHLTSSMVSSNDVIRGCNENVISRIASISLDMLKDLSQLEREEPGFCAMLKDAAFVTSNKGELRKPTELYDPDTNSHVLDMKFLLPPEYFPSSELYADSISLASLRKLGMHSTLDCNGVLSVAKEIESEFNAINNEHSGASSLVPSIVSKGSRLLKYLDVHVETLLKEADPKGLSDYIEAQEVDAVGNVEESSQKARCVIPGGEWGEKLRRICWVPTHIASPAVGELSEILPWPSKTHSSVLGSPSQCTVIENVWLCSRTFKICAVNIKSKVLRLLLGWSAPIPARVAALQILNIHYQLTNGKIICPGCAITDHSHGRLLEVEIFKIYDCFLHAIGDNNTPNSREEIAVWINVLKEKPVIWVPVATGGYTMVSSDRIAFRALSSAVSTEPFLYVVRSELTKYTTLLEMLGVRQSFSPTDIVDLLRQMKLNRPNGTPQLSFEEVEKCVALLSVLSKFMDSKAFTGNLELSADEASNALPSVALHSLGEIYVPDMNNVLMDATLLTYNDAEWTKKNPSILTQHRNMKFVQGSISNKIAAQLGCKSFREQLFQGDSIPCPSANILKNIIQNDTIDDLAKDFLSLADSLQCDGIHFFYDQRTYANESLLHPGLANTQGPALLCFLEGNVVDSEVITKLLSTPDVMGGDTVHNSSPWSPGNSGDVEGELSTINKILGRYPKPGKGLASAFVISDCVEILSGDSFYVYDPCGLYLLDAQDYDTPGNGNRLAKAQKCSLYGGLAPLTSVAEQSSALIRFPDQFAPMKALPFSTIQASLWSFRNSIGGTPKPYLPGVLIRMPLRTAVSKLSCLVPTENNIKFMLVNCRHMLEGALLFAHKLIYGTCQHALAIVDADITSDCGDNCTLDFEVKLLSSSAARAQRWKLLCDKSWRPAGVLGIFSRAFSPLELNYDLIVAIKMGYYELDSGDEPSSFLPWGAFLRSAVEITNPARDSANSRPRERIDRPSEFGDKQFDARYMSVEYNNTWKIFATLGAGKTRELACKSVFYNTRLVPFVAAALLLSSREACIPSNCPPPIGFYYNFGGVAGVSGLPIHLEGPFLQDYPQREFPLPVSSSSGSRRSGTERMHAISNMSIDSAAKYSASRRGSVGSASLFGYQHQQLSGDDIRTWNSALLLTALNQIYPRYLELLRDRVFAFRGASASNTISSNDSLRVLEVGAIEKIARIYRFWPFAARMRTSTQDFVLKSGALERLLTMKILLTQSGYLSLENVVVFGIGYNFGAMMIDTKEYLCSCLALTCCPHQVVSEVFQNDVSASSFNLLSPKRLRDALKRDPSSHCRRLVNGNMLHVFVELLFYCTKDITTNVSNDADLLQAQQPVVVSYSEDSDILVNDAVVVSNSSHSAPGATSMNHILRSAMKDLGGIPLLMTADKAIRCFPLNSRDRLVCDSYVIQKLVPQLRKYFVHPFLMQKFNVFHNHYFRSALYLTSLDALFLLENIHDIIPSALRRCGAVVWDGIVEDYVIAENSGNVSHKPAISPAIIYTIWKDVLSKTQDIGLLDSLSDYPILPVVSGGVRMLISPSMLPFVMYTNQIGLTAGDVDVNLCVGQEYNRSKLSVDADVENLANDVKLKGGHLAAYNAQQSGPEVAIEKDWLWVSAPAFCDASDTVKRLSENSIPNSTSVVSVPDTTALPVASMAGSSVEIVNNATAIDSASTSGTVGSAPLPVAHVEADATSSIGVLSQIMETSTPAAAPETARTNSSNLDQSTMRGAPLEAYIHEIPSNVLSAIVDCGMPMLDVAFFDNSPPDILRRKCLGSSNGKRLLEGLYELQENGVMVYEINSSAQISVEPIGDILKLDNLSIDARRNILKEMLNSHRTAAFTAGEINKLKTIRLFTPILSSDSSTTVGLQHMPPIGVNRSDGVYWSQAEGAIEGLTLTDPARPLSAIGGVFASLINPNNSSHATSAPVVLVNDMQLRGVYDIIGAEELTASMAVKRFTVPRLKAMNAHDRHSVMKTLAKKWSFYKNDRELINSLKDLPFIPAWFSSYVTTGAMATRKEAESYGELDFSRPVRRAKEVLTWTSVGLINVLQGTESFSSYYPPPFMKTEPEWLDMLTDLGSTFELDKDKFLRIVSDIHDLVSNIRHASDAVAVTDVDGYTREDIMMQEAYGRGKRLLEYVKSDDHTSSFLDTELARKIANLSFVPVSRPIGVELGGFVKYEQVVVRMSDTVSYQQGALAFSVLPILEEQLAPPQFFFSTLGICTAPPTDMVMKHYLNLIQVNKMDIPNGGVSYENAEATLDRWNCEKHSIKDTFVAIFQYFGDHWQNVRPGDKDLLRSSLVNSIPVDNNNLAKPSRLFFRLTNDLSPFMHEIPRHLGSCEKFLKECIGIQETPQLTDYKSFLNELANECKSNSLNPNELRATLTIVRTVADMVVSDIDNGAVAKATRSMDKYDNVLYVPDEMSILRDCKSCVINDNTWLKSQAEEGLRNIGLFILHPSISRQLASRIGVTSRLSKIVSERMVNDIITGPELPTEPKFSALYSDIFKGNMDLSTAISALVLKAQIEFDVDSTPESSFASVSVPTVSIETAPGGSSRGDLFDRIPSILERLQIKFLPNMSTYLVLKDPRDTNVATDVQEIGLGECNNPVCFVNISDDATVLYVNCSMINGSILTPEVALSLGLCELFELDKSIACSVACILTACVGKQKIENECFTESGHNMVRSLLSLLHIGCDAAAVRERLRGIPGEPLTDVDAGKVSISPNHIFSVGDIVALDADSTSSSADCLKYGRVLSVSHSNNILQVPKLKIKTGQSADDIVSLLTTEVYTFASARRLLKTNDKNIHKRKNPFRKLVKRASEQIACSINGTSKSSSASGVKHEAIDVLPAPPIGALDNNVDVADALYSLMSRAGIPVSMETKSMVDRIIELETLNRRLEKEANIARYVLYDCSVGDLHKLLYFSKIYIGGNTKIVKS